MFSSVFFLLENTRRVRPKDTKTESVERQRIFHRNRTSVLTGRSIREKEALKLKEMEQKKGQPAAVGRFPAGPVCEDMLCSACKVVVEEFGILMNINDF